MKDIIFHLDLFSRLISLRDRLPHAILLAGPPGILKTEFARDFAAALLCETPSATGHACLGCSACNWFSQGNHPDFRWLRPAALVDNDIEEGAKKAAAKEKPSKEITIDQVREIGDFLNLGTHRAGARVVLITPAEAMNRNTANAVLKSLEEPRPGTVFLLVSDAAERLLPTIRSRCMGFDMHPPDRASALRWLLDQGVKEAEKWLDRSGGAPRHALDIAQGGQGKLLQVLEKAFCTGREIDTIALAAETDRLLRADPGLTAYAAVDWTQRWLVDAVLSLHHLTPYYFPEHKAHLARIFSQADDRKLLKFNAETVEYKKLSQHTLNNRLFFEDFYSKYAHLLSPGNA